MKVLLMARLIFALLGSFAGGAAAAPSVAAGTAPAYVVAAVPAGTESGFRGIASSAEVRFCLPVILNTGPTTCLDLFGPTLFFAPLTASSAGTIIWADASTPAFGHVVAAITDGVNGFISWAWLVGQPPLGGFGTTMPEAVFFGAGSGGVDLAGYTIERIGLRLDAISFESPGEDPNGDGIWTDSEFQGAFLFEGRIAPTPRHARTAAG
jgi:hypothetical protein